MLKNYLKIALRNLLNHKIYSIINIAGLAIGMACTILLALYVQNELSYDNYFKRLDSIYRVVGNFKLSGNELKGVVSPAIFAQTCLEEIPEVEKTVRFRRNGDITIKKDKNIFTENDNCFVDNSVFDMFNIKVLAGNPLTVLLQPNEIALSEKGAKKYFGSENPVGKTLLLNNNTEYIVTAVFKNIPSNTHFYFDYFLSMPSLTESKSSIWLANNFQTYLLLKESADPQNVEKKFIEFVDKYIGPEIERVMGRTLAEIKGQEGNAAYILQPVKDIHLHSDLIAELGTNSDIKYVYIFSIIALFILIIACVNYMNISTARSATRAKEVGIRKVLGSDKKSLVKQFLTESFITTFFSLLISIGLIKILSPYFNNITGKEIPISFFSNTFLLFSMLAILFVIGILAGSYPSFILSKYQPIHVLKGKAKSSVKSGMLRSALVIFQFTTSIILIVSTTVVMTQLKYIQNKKIGFDRNNILIANNAYLLGDQIETFKNEMLKFGEVKKATISNFLPVPSGYNNSLIYMKGKNEEGISMQQWSVDYDYIETLNMKIIEGRNFSREFGSDKNAVIINQACAKQFAIANPIGQVMTKPTNIQRNGELRDYIIIGVVEDFNYESLRNTIAPIAIFLGNEPGMISFKIRTSDISGLIAKFNSVWDKFLPGQPFQYSFMDERFNNIYFAEERISKIFGTFATIAIFIGCLGLFSLSAFASEQKTKEIGIRKVLGASVYGIVSNLSIEFTKWVVIANIIAWPVAYFFMNKWLQDFAYRIDISWWIFALSGGIALVIALVTVSFQAIKAATANPVESLKYE
ncbi:MAG: ABC transporter permease [Melioribacteraceae bacterium]